MGNPRKTAFKVLLKIEQDHAYSNLALNSEIKDSGLDSRDAAFVSALVYGVLERKLTLDYIISQYSKIRLKKIENRVLTILRMGVYQIVFMDKIPPGAAVNESVKLAKQNRLFSSAGFINGVLRSLVRANGKYSLPDINKDKLSYYCAAYSCPKEIISLWIDSYGEDKTVEILKNLSGRPPVTVRVNTVKITKENLIKKLKEEGITAVSCGEAENALILSSTGAIEKLDAYKNGYFHVQDLSSQLCCQALGAQKNMAVYDFCSAPGGKSFTLAQIMENRGVIKAFDLYEHKIKLINNGAKRLSLDIVKAEVRDALSAAPLKEADRVLCDVPCSGLGIMRRKPEIRYKDDPGFDTLPQLQYKILENCSKYVKTGGILVYSTCTLNPKENNENANKFLEEHENFQPLKIDFGDNIKRNFFEPENQLTLFPKKNGSDGFFISAFKRIK